MHRRHPRSLAHFCLPVCASERLCTLPNGVVAVLQVEALREGADMTIADLELQLDEAKEKLTLKKNRSILQRIKDFVE